MQLPSNRKFGFTFSFLTAVGSIYLFYSANHTFAFAFGALSTAFLLTTMLKESILLPLNKLWMKFGLLLSMVVKPIVFGIIFFGIFTPVALIMRLIGRDELKLNFSTNGSQWKLRSDVPTSGSFRYPF